MKQRFRLYRRNHGGRFYVHDNVTGKQESLKTTDRSEALRVLHAKNEAEKQPAINLQIARAYLVAGDPAIGTRTWQVAMEAVVKLKQGSTRERWQAAVHDKAFDVIRRLPILETRPEHFVRVLELGTVATNVYLRRLHNFTLAVSWLPWPVLNKQQWPRVRYKEKRGVTAEEHRTVVAAERNPERKAFFEQAWHLGAAQGDLATLGADNIDWENRVISFRRKKTGTVAVLRFGEEVEAVLRRLPAFGPFFPNLSRLPSTERASIFRLRCQALGIEGVTLHSYRYAWAERARKCGYPERFAKEALGHESNAVHWAYAKKAKVEAPPLEEYEKRSAEEKLIVLQLQKGVMLAAADCKQKSGATPSRLIEEGKRYPGVATARRDALSHGKAGSRPVSASAAIGDHVNGRGRAPAQNRRISLGEEIPQFRQGCFSLRLALSNRPADGGDFYPQRNPPRRPRTGSCYANRLE